MAKTILLAIRVTPEEKADWDKKASLCGVKLAKWIRDACNAAHALSGINPVAKTAVQDDILPDEDKPVRIKGEKPPCPRCVRFNYVGQNRNLNCPDCGR